MSWIDRQFLITTCYLFLAMLVFRATNIDLLLQDQLFNFETNKWLWDRDEAVSKFLLYDGIKALYVLFALIMLLVVFFLRNRISMQPYRRGVIIVCISLFIVPGFANLAKAVTNVPCPKDLTLYGGDYPYVSFMEDYPDDFIQEQNIKCYPAGHASGGFALLSLFFLISGRKARIVSVASALVTGWTVGFYKMIIGDHFFSHTVIMMILSWMLILLIARIVNCKFEPEAANYTVYFPP